LKTAAKSRRTSERPSASHLPVAAWSRFKASEKVLLGIAAKFGNRSFSFTLDSRATPS